MTQKEKEREKKERRQKHRRRPSAELARPMKVHAPAPLWRDGCAEMHEMRRDVAKTFEGILQAFAGLEILDRRVNHWHVCKPRVEVAHIIFRRLGKR